jgi:hypothetical protein
MQWKYEVGKFGEANGIDNELKIRRWVIHQVAIDEKFVIRTADDFTWADEVIHDQVKETTNEEGEIEGMLICKWNHKALRHYGLEKEMQLRQQQREEQAMEIRDTAIETQQQQKHKNKKDKERKEITKTNRTTEWIQEWLADDDCATRRNRRTRAAIKDGITGTTKGTPQRRHAQSQRNTGVLWTQCNCHGQPSRTNRNGVC